MFLFWVRHHGHELQVSTSRYSVHFVHPDDVVCDLGFCALKNSPVLAVPGFNYAYSFC